MDLFTNRYCCIPTCIFECSFNLMRHVLVKFNQHNLIKISTLDVSFNIK